MLEKICEECQQAFTLLRSGKKEQGRRFCGPVCSRRWAAKNRSESWHKKASFAKQGQHNPMYGVSQTNPNSLKNLVRGYWTGKSMSTESNIKRSIASRGRKMEKEWIQKAIQTKIEKGLIYSPDDPYYLEFKKYRRKVYYWTAKNDLTILNNSDRRGRLDFHLDHKYSIAEGFKNSVPPKIIGSIHNLQFLDHKVNTKKGTACSITLEELYALQR